MVKSKKKTIKEKDLPFIYKSSLFLSWALFMPWISEVLTEFLNIGPLLQLGLCLLAFVGILICAALTYEDGTNETFWVPFSIFCMAIFYISWKALPSWAAILAPRNGVLVWYFIVWGIRLIDSYHSKVSNFFQNFNFHLFSR